MGAVQPRLEVRDRPVRAREVRRLADRVGTLAERGVLVAEFGQPVVALPAVGPHDRAGRGRVAHERAQRGLAGILKDREAQTP